MHRVSRFAFIGSILCAGLLLSACNNIYTSNFVIREPQPVIDEVRTGGFYYAYKTYPEKIYMDIIVLWPDGTAAGFSRQRWRSRDPRDTDVVVRDMITEFIRYLEVASLNREKEGPPSWGAFRVDQDSIMIQQVFKYYEYGTDLHYMTRTRYGRIENDSTFTVTRRIDDIPADIPFLKRVEREETDVHRTFRFRPLAAMPPSHNWLKRRFASR